MSQEILLDTGTNEVEILEFYLGTQSFGINVAKVLQIVAYDESKFTAIPGDDPAQPGVLLLWHDRTIPLINLNAALNRKSNEKAVRPIVLVTRFNDVVNGFLISSVNRIHRINWDQLEPVSSIIEKHSSNITGTVTVEGEDILLVDFEYLIAELFPETKMSENLKESDVVNEKGRSDVHIVFAEDSTFIRNSVTGLLAQVGFTHVDVFENGHDAFVHLEKMAAKAVSDNVPVAEYVSLVVTDIEMPKMDGLTLCRKIRDELKMDKVPVAIFSSLIDDQMSVKCKEVGADVYATKPKISELIGMIDGLLKINDEPSLAKTG